MPALRALPARTPSAAAHAGWGPAITCSPGLAGMRHITATPLKIRRARCRKVVARCLPPQAVAAAGPLKDEDIVFVTGEELGSMLVDVDLVRGERVELPTPDSDEEAASPFEPTFAWRRETLFKILAFAGPALVIPLADPMMSFIDTLAVSQYASTMELAALGPNTAIFNFCNFAFASLSVTTMSVVSNLIGKGERAAAGQTISHGISLAAASGVAIAATLLVFGQHAIGAITSNPALVGPAVEYLSTRALAAPAVLAVMVCNAGMLAQKDSLTPCKVVLASAALNCGLDAFLIAGLGMGLKGAAIATAVAQWACAGTLVALHVRGAGGLSPVPFAIPRPSQLNVFFGAMGPLSVVYVGKEAVYLAMQTTATLLSTLAVAAHQMVWALWEPCSFAFIPLEQAAVAYLPAARSNAEARETIGILVATGVAAGGVLGLVCALPAVVPSFFSPDPALWPAMRSVCPMALGSLVLAGVDVSINGVILARQELWVLASRMALNLSVMGAYAVWMRGAGPSLVGVWRGILLFFSLRAGLNLAHLLGSVLPSLSDEGDAKGDAKGVGVAAALA